MAIIEKWDLGFCLSHIHITASATVIVVAGAAVTFTTPAAAGAAGAAGCCFHLKCVQEII